MFVHAKFRRIVRLGKVSRLTRSINGQVVPELGNPLFTRD